MFYTDPLASGLILTAGTLIENGRAGDRRLFLVVGEAGIVCLLILAIGPLAW